MNEWMNEWTNAKHSSNKKCHKFKRSRLMRLFKTGRQLTPTRTGWEQQVPFHTVREHADGKQWLRRNFIQAELPDISPTKSLVRLTRQNRRICTKYKPAWLGFRREADGKCVLVYYTASSGNSFPTFQDNLSVPSSRVKNPSSHPQKNWNFSTGFI